jgi:hypothetical protein
MPEVKERGRLNAKNKVKSFICGFMTSGNQALLNLKSNTNNGHRSDKYIEKQFKENPEILSYGEKNLNR